MGKSELIEKQPCYLKVAVLISPFCQKTDTFSTPPRRSQPLNSLTQSLNESRKLSQKIIPTKQTVTPRYITDNSRLRLSEYRCLLV